MSASVFSSENPPNTDTRIKMSASVFSSENPPNTDTRIIRTLWHVPLVSVLTRFHCTWKLLSPGFWPLATHEFLNQEYDLISA